MGSLLDRIYGVLFQPHETLPQLRDQPQVWQAAVVITLLSLLHAQDTAWNLGTLILAVLGGTLGWLTLSGIVWLLAFSMGRDPRFLVVLTLTGFAGLPWLLWTPLHLWGGWVGSLAGLLVLLWWCVWQVWSLSIALGIPWWRLVWVVPLTFIAIGVSISWIGNLIGLATVMA